MGRPEPCVLFSQTFVHSQLDEYVDEVLFSEPIVITACEFLELNSSSASQAVSLVGATSPPSFALEVFVQCEGETRFRRLCHPFLYSHSSSNVLEVEAVVTNHLVVRGSYRSLSLVIYGNTAEDLGQFSIEFDDNSLSNLVTSAEGKLEDLPLALRSTDRTVEESLNSLKVLSLPIAPSDLPTEVKCFVNLFLKIMGMQNIDNSVDKIMNAVVAAVCSYVRRDACHEAINQKLVRKGDFKNFQEISQIMLDATKDLLELLQQGSSDESAKVLAECSFLESEADLATSKELVDVLSQYFCFNSNSAIVGHHQLRQSKNVLWGLSVALLLCSGKESCFHFVHGGGMELVAHLFSNNMQSSSAVSLMLLGVIEQATRYPIGCEGILGWWPREDECIPSGISNGYSQLLKLFLQKPRHDVASLSTYVLHRLRFYEVASRYESAVLSVLDGTSVAQEISIYLSMLRNVQSQLDKLLKLINIRGPIEDPSPLAYAIRSLIVGESEGLLTYKTTRRLIGSSKSCFSNWDIDSQLLLLLKEKGFLPLSAALLSSPTLCRDAGDTVDIFSNIVSTIGAILLSLLTCRSGLVFLLHQPELSTTLIDALRGISDMKKEESAPLSYASALLSKGFVCSPQEVGIIVEMHLRVVNAIDRLLLSTPYSEEFLWVLWELCGLSRSECGRQALLVLVHFPEAISILIEALHSFKESEPVEKNGTSPINLATFHSAAEIFEVIVTDATASSLNSWIDHAMEVHKALHSSSPGSIRKDAPTRLLELVDAGVVYQKNGAIGLLRYSAVLASGGDAHLPSSSILVADLTNVDSAVGDSSSGSDVNVMDNLGKIVSEKTFDGVPLRDSSITQLTTATRILAFVSESSTIAAALYDEGAIIVIYAILVNCSFMLERSSNNYDYLVDDGTECNSTSDLLLERNREQSLVDLLIPSLVLLVNLLQKLKDAKEQHRNTKLLNALLRLHREVSPKLAACAADLSSPYPDFALGFGAVCHLVVSALTCWPVYGWTPGLFHSLLANVHATSILALGPKETCSLLCLLNDLFPEEGLWFWRNGIPLLTALRKLAVGTLLGSQKEIQINWYLKPSHVGKLLGQLSPHLDKIAQIIQHYAISALVVIQDMLRVFIVRIACLKAENAALLLRPMLSFLQGHASNPLGPSEMDVYKVYGYLEFLASLLEHPCAKALLLEEGLVQILAAAMEKCFNAIKYESKQTLDTKNPVASGFTVTNWCLPIFKSFSFLCSSLASLPHPRKRDLYSSANLSTKDCSLILPYLLKFCEVLPIGRELLSCLLLLKDIGSSIEGRCAFMTTFCDVNTIDERKVENGHGNRGNHNFDISEYRRRPPFLCCWTKLLKSVDSREVLSTCAIQAVTALSIGCVQLCIDGKSLNLNAVSAIKFLFGLYDDMDGVDGSSESIGILEKMVSVLSSKITDNNGFTSSDMRDILSQALELTKSLLLLLTKPSSSVSSHHIVHGAGLSLPLNDIPVSSQVNHQEDFIAEKADDYIILGGLGDKFLWECPLPERLSQNLQGKRKLSSLDGAAKRVKGESAVAELAGQNSFGRNLGQASASSGPTRRDTFRQRKPNTSRPPSMHVDDYVARERSVDGVSSNVIAVRVGSSSGRAPSIHVDEFMARQRERQNPSAAVVEEPSVQVKNAASVNDPDKDKVNNSKQLKADLDDDLHGIDIVFDGEESEADDKLPFLQPDYILQQPDSVMVEQRSPHSIIEEPESEANASKQFSCSEMPVVPNNDENTQSEFSSRMSVSRPEIPVTRESSVSSDKKFYEHSDDLKNIVPMRTSNVFDSGAFGSTSGFPPYSNAPESLVQLPTDSRMNHQSFYAKDSPQNGAGSWGTYDQKVPPNQPPLPPTPPPSTFSAKLPPAPNPSSSLSSPFVNSTEMQHPMGTSFHVRSDYLSPIGNVPTSVASSISTPDTKYACSSMSSPNDAGPQPPLPPMPPPFSAGSYHLSTSRAVNSGYSVGVPELLQVSMSPGLGDRMVSGAGVTSYAPPPLIPSMVISRPVPVHVSSYGSTPTQQQNENSNTVQSFPILPSSVQSMHQLQPLQPPLQRRPLQSQHLWPTVQSSHHVEQGSLQSSVQMQVHQMEMLQQSHIPSLQTQYQSQQQEYTRSRQPQHHQVPQHSQTQVLTQQAEVASQQQQQDFGLSLQEYFQDPKAITSLLSNKEELCRLLEQHPKLMQMLQERLGQQ